MPQLVREAPNIGHFSYVAGRTVISRIQPKLKTKDRASSLLDCIVALAKFDDVEMSIPPFFMIDVRLWIAMRWT